MVLSLLLAAATITFVNTTSYDRQAQAALVARVQNEVQSLTDARTRAAADLERLNSEIQRLSAQLAQRDQALATAEATIANNAAQLARANADAQLAQADNSRLTAALTALQQTQGTQQAQLASLRAELDQLQTQNGELNVALADARNRLDVTETARRIAEEQREEFRTQIDRFRGLLRGRGIDPDAVAAGNTQGAPPPINGVIRDTQQIAGIPFATISVGTDDAVRPGMEFKVLDRANGQFLGVLTVTNAEPNEAVGRLSGPAVQAIRAGNEVRTQL